MTTPSVPDFLAGYAPQQPDFQSLWVNPATFFRARVVFRASQTTTATTLSSSGNYSTIIFDNIIEDPYSGWSNTLHHWVAPAGYSGTYLATFQVYVGTAVAVNTILAIEIGGTNQIEPATATACAGTTGVVCMNYQYLVGGQDGLWGTAAVLNSGVNVSTDLTNGQNSTFEIIWISS